MNAEHAAGPRRRRNRCIQKPNSRPVATTSSMTTYDADMRVWAYCRSSSRSKAGRVPLVDVNRSRASRTPLRRGPPIADRRCDRRFSRKLDDFGLIGGFTHQTTQILPANDAGFCIVYLWR